MQRIGTLIEKLNEQYNSNASPGALLITTQLLLNELSTELSKAQSITQHVSVIVPGSSPLPIKQTEPSFSDSIPKESFVEKPETVNQNMEKQDSITAPEIISEEKNETAEEINPYEKKEPEKEIPAKKESRPSDFVHAQQWLYDLQNEIPTLAQQPKKSEQPKPVNEGNTLNDRLKTEKNELGNLLKNQPIKDLRKAIGINDRFRFINELFRGDESVFDRSIKTINSFNAFAEAEVWIKRELKIKLGWDEKSETVKNFDQLVSRRFS